MQYIEYIEESKTWTCPKAGKWKIICVGGGASGYGVNASNIYMGHAGGASSFGKYLTAKGGNTQYYSSSFSDKVLIGAFNGFTGNSNNYGNIVLANVGLGYGAASLNNFLSLSGLPGEMKTTIIDLEENENISCTIGKGGTSPSYSGTALLGGHPAKDGVIVVQYLGE